MRPLSSRVLEAAFDLAYLASAAGTFGGHVMLGLDIPRVGRLRGDLTVLPAVGAALPRDWRAST